MGEWTRMRSMQFQMREDNKQKETEIEKRRVKDR